MIKGRVEAYVHETEGGRLAPTGEEARHSLREASYLGVWGPGSIWGLNNVLLGGFSEVTLRTSGPLSRRVPVPLRGSARVCY